MGASTHSRRAHLIVPDNAKQHTSAGLSQLSVPPQSSAAPAYQEWHRRTPLISCQCSTGSWLVTMVNGRPCR
jgi:hypothetical protein